MPIKLLSIMALIIFFRIVDFNSFFIIMAAVSMVQIYYVFVEREQVGFSLVFKVFYIGIAIAILMNISLEVLPASGLIIVCLSALFYMLAWISESVVSMKRYIKPQKYNVAMILGSCMCIIISLLTRNQPTKIWIAPAVLVFFIVLRDLCSSYFSKAVEGSNV